MPGPDKHQQLAMHTTPRTTQPPPFCYHPPPTCTARCPANCTASGTSRAVAMLPMYPGRALAMCRCCSAMTRRLMRLQQHHQQQEAYVTNKQQQQEQQAQGRHLSA